MIFTNTHIFVKRRSNCKNVGTVWSLAEGKGNVEQEMGENSVVGGMGVVPGEIMMEK